MAGPGIRNLCHFRDEMASLPTHFVLFVPRCSLSFSYNSSASNISLFWYSRLGGSNDCQFVEGSLQSIQHTLLRYLN